MEMSVGLEGRIELAMACLVLVMLVGEAGGCPLTDTGLSYESIVASGYWAQTERKGGWVGVVW